MSQYWTSENVVKIEEMAVSIPSEQGKSYQVGDVSRRVSFDIPESVKFLDGSASYLEFKMKIDTPATADVGAQGGQTRLQCDPAGAGMIVQNLRIYSGDRGTLIEEINEYNQLVALKHDYDSDAAMREVTRLEEGGTTYQPRCASTRGASHGAYNDLYTNPWFKKPSNVNTNAYDVTEGQNTVKCCVPLHLSGVFSGEIWPNMLTGLYVELDLAPAPSIIRQLDTVVQSRRRTANPLVLGFEDNAGNDVALPLVAGAADTLAAVYLAAGVNGIIADRVDSCPFVVGERIRFVSSTAVGALVANTLDATPAASGCLIAQIQAGVFGATPCVKLVFDQLYTNGAAGGGRGAAINAASCVFSSSAAEATTYPVKYTITDLNLIAHQVMMESRYETAMLQKAREGSAIEFDIRSYTNYKNSTTSTDTQATIQIFANNHKAKSLIVLPTSSQSHSNGDLISSTGTYTVTEDTMDTVLESARPGIAGINDFLTDYQFQMNGVLQPSRPVSTRKIATRKSIDQFHLYELDKGLANAGISPRSLKKFMENFVISRGFAVNGGAQDLRDIDLTLLLNYSETLPAGVDRKNKMFSSFVSHVRRVTLKGGSVSILM